MNVSFQKLAPAADTLRARVGQEGVTQKTVDPCAAVMFKVVLALSLVDRRKLTSHRTSVDMCCSVNSRWRVCAVERVPRGPCTAAKCPVSCSDKDHHAGGVDGCFYWGLRLHWGCAMNIKNTQGVCKCGERRRALLWLPHLHCLHKGASCDHSLFKRSKRVGYATEAV